jgi:hypothetical protein
MPALKPYDVRIITAGGTIRIIVAKDPQTGQPMWGRTSAPTLNPQINTSGITSYATVPQNQGVFLEVGDTSLGAGAYYSAPGKYAFGVSVDTSLGITYPGPAVVHDTLIGGGSLDGPIWDQTHYRDRDWIAAGSKVYFWDYVNNGWDEPATQPTAAGVKITGITSYAGILLVAHDTAADYEYSTDEGATWHVPVAGGQTKGKHWAVREQRSSNPILVMVNDPNTLYQTEDPTDSNTWDNGTPVGDLDNAGADHFTGVFTAPTGDLYVSKRLGLRHMDANDKIDMAYGPVQSSAGIGLENFAWPQIVGQRVYVQTVDYDIVEIDRGNVRPGFGVRFHGSNVPEMQKAIVALAGDGTEWLYAALEGTEGYVMRGRYGGDGKWQWHGAYAATGDRVNNRMWVTSHPLSTDQNSYLVISAKSAPYLPYRCLIPAGDLETNADAQFALSSWIRFGREDAAEADITKVLSSSKPVTRNLDSTHTVELQYRLNTPGAFTSLGTFTESPEPTDVTNTYYPAGTNGKWFEIKAVLTVPSADEWLALERVVTRVFLRPPRADRLDFTVLAQTGATTRTGARAQMSAQGLKNALYNAQRAITPPTVVQDWDTNAAAAPNVWTVDIEDIQETWLHYSDEAPALAYRVICQELPTITSVARSVSGVPHNHKMDTFAGTGAQVAFTLSSLPVGPLLVYVAGVYMEEGVGKDFTRSGTLVTFAVAPALSAVIDIRYAY